jgi:hypothetical protein
MREKNTRSMNKDEFWAIYSQQDETNRRKMLNEDLPKVKMS